MKLGKNSIAASIFTILIGLSVVSSIPSIKADSEAPQMQWSSSAYDGYSGSWVIQTDDGGFAVTGTNAKYSAEGRGYGDYYPMLVKTDSSGKMQWSKTYGPQYGGAYGANSVMQTKDRGYVLSGRHGWLIKTDSEGNVLWNKTLELLASYVVIQTSDGDYVLAGFMENNNGGENALIVKTDENGNVLWEKTFSRGSSIVSAYAIVETDDGEYAVAGTYGGDYWFSKTDINGNLLWNQTYDYYDYYQVSPATISSVAKTKDGGYILAGGDGSSAWLIKTDSEGNEQWNHPYLESAFVSVAQSVDGGYIMAGRYNMDYRTAWLVKTDSSGNVQWAVPYADVLGPRTSYSVIVTEDGGYAVAGQLANSLWLAKFAQESNTPPPPQPSEPFPTTWIVAAIAIVAIGVLAAIFVYFRIKKTKEKVG